MRSSDETLCPLTAGQIKHINQIKNRFHILPRTLKKSTLFQFVGTFSKTLMDMMHIRQYDHITLQLNIILHNSKYHNKQR